MTRHTEMASAALRSTGCAGDCVIPSAVHGKPPPQVDLRPQPTHKFRCLESLEPFTVTWLSKRSRTKHELSHLRVNAVSSNFGRKAKLPTWSIWFSVKVSL